MSESSSSAKSPNDGGADTNAQGCARSYPVKWLVIGWLVAVVMAILAWEQAFAGAQARREATVERLQADLARAQAEQLRQQLEAERIIAAREIAILREHAQSTAPSQSAEIPQSSQPRQ